MKNYVEDGTLIISLQGNVDTSNAEAVEKELNDIVAAVAHQEITLDIEDVEYISSAGLRVILRLLKAEHDVKIINASSDVYEILDMTGFTSMMDVSKAYRKLSVDGCDIIGKGSNGTVYRYSEDIVIKVYHNNDALPDIHRERELARTAFILGVNTAIPYDVVKVDDKYGSVFELLSAKSLTKLIQENPDKKEEYVHIFTDMLKSIHKTHVKAGILPSIRETYLDYANFLKDHLEAAYADKLYKLIEAVPEADTMIHGDYHTNNVHYANNESILIDMDTLAVGNPVFEFASIFNAYHGFALINPNAIFEFLGMDSDLCDYTYDQLMKEYFATDDYSIYDDRCQLLGYTRLLRRTIRRQPELTDKIEQMKGIIYELLDRTDSLAM
ncbi:MAG: anti-sigma factor antagonist [Eubacteriales bacterium]|nr:anti-sigma factor antagonist [Eubacteriales bacterium]